MDILWKYSSAFIEGAFITISLAGISWVIGITLGIIIGFICTSNALLKQLFAIVSFIIATIPIIVLLFWSHYPLQTMLGVNVDPFITSSIIFSCVNMILVSQIIIKTEANLPDEYIHCAQFAKLDSYRIFLKVQLPLILRQSVPSILNTQIVVLHMTLFASLISVNELFRTAQRINSMEYQPVEIYSLIAVFYFLLALPIAVAAHLYKEKNAKQGVGDT